MKEMSRIGREMLPEELSAVERVNKQTNELSCAYEQREKQRNLRTFFSSVK